MRLLVTDTAAQSPRQATAWLIMTLGRIMKESLHPIQRGVESILCRLALYGSAWIIGFYVPIVIVSIVLSGIYPDNREPTTFSGFSFFVLPLISIFIHPLGVLVALLNGIGAVLFARVNLRLYWLLFPFVLAILYASIVLNFKK